MIYHARAGENLTSKKKLANFYEFSNKILEPCNDSSTSEGTKNFSLNSYEILWKCENPFLTVTALQLNIKKSASILKKFFNWELLNIKPPWAFTKHYDWEMKEYRWMK